MSDYSALAQRVSLSIAGIRGCLMLSRDGMVLGAHPEGDAEAGLRAAWVRFAGVGDPERSYIDFPDQIWAFVRRGAYGAFAVADIGVRPGVLVDTLEQSLMAGEQDRANDREMMWLPDAPAAPSGKPRTILHKPERPSSDPEPMIVPSEVPAIAAEGSAPVAGPDVAPQAHEAGGSASPDREEVAPSSESVPDMGPGAEGPDGETPYAEGDADEPEGPEASLGPEAPEGPDASEASEALEGKEEESEVDRILLAKEFAGLLQVPREDDEASR
jgi:hypothetical protein